jgi:hypothetical protein
MGFVGREEAILMLRDFLLRGLRRGRVYCPASCQVLSIAGKHISLYTSELIQDIS